MAQAWKLYVILSGLGTVTGCSATGTSADPQYIPPPANPSVLATLEAPTPAVSPKLPAVPSPQADDRPLPINLPTAMRLANVRAVDVAAAAERIQVAAAVLEHAAGALASHYCCGRGLLWPFRPNPGCVE